MDMAKKIFEVSDTDMAGSLGHVFAKKKKFKNEISDEQLI